MPAYSLLVRSSNAANKMQVHTNNKTNAFIIFMQNKF